VIKFLFVAAGIARIGLAQPAPAKPLAFEVASVRQNKSQDPRVWRTQFLPGGRFTATNAPLVFIVGLAHNIPFKSDRLVGGPDWIQSEHYDIDAKADKNTIPDGLSAKAREVQMRPMLQVLLADRFKITVHRETKVRPAYVMVVARNGPKLQESKKQEKDCPELYPTNKSELEHSCHFVVGGQGGGIHGKAVDMSDVAQFMETWSDRPFIDGTGLTGLFDIDTEGWVPLIPRQGPLPGVAPSAEDIAMADPARPTLALIFDRLGLKIESNKVGVEIIVIDHAERPTEN
jgi:uncharacterized protein (TIGR03435 family)